jgi:hypothetical protein
MGSNPPLDLVFKQAKASTSDSQYSCYASVPEDSTQITELIQECDEYKNATVEFSLRARGRTPVSIAE